MQISDLHNPWRDKYTNATFRNQLFFVETNVRAGGRRVALHQYPKRNTPYAEDMGRAANRFQVQGYLITGKQMPNYLAFKDQLITALEQDGPGWLSLPLEYQMQDTFVMVMSYSVTETRELGGYCIIQMEFSEYGDPSYRQVISTEGEIAKSATAVEDDVIGPDLTTDPQSPQVEQAAPYAGVYEGANIGNDAPPLSNT